MTLLDHSRASRKDIDDISFGETETKFSIFQRMNDTHTHTHTDIHIHSIIYNERFMHNDKHDISREFCDSRVQFITIPRNDCGRMQAKVNLHNIYVNG